MAVLVCLTRKNKPTRVCAKNRGLGTSVRLKWVSNSFTLSETSGRNLVETEAVYNGHLGLK